MSNSSQHPADSRDPAWRDFRTFRGAELPHRNREWLLDEGSLTERLVRRSGGNFRVQRLSQGWRTPLRSEQLLLGLPARQRALVREVVLYCHEQPWVFARSVIPAIALSGPLRHLRQLKNQSLGALIFQHPGLQRSDFELALLPPGSRYIHPDLRQAEPAWARRSKFIIAGKPMLVSEVFLRQFQP